MELGLDDAAVLGATIVVSETTTVVTPSLLESLGDDVPVTADVGDPDDPPCRSLVNPNKSDSDRFVDLECFVRFS